MAKMSTQDVIDFCQKALDVHGIKAKIIMNAELARLDVHDNAEAARPEPDDAGDRTLPATPETR